MRFPGYIIGKVVVSALLGLGFSSRHYVSIGHKLFDNGSWFLSALISTAMLCLYYATQYSCGSYFLKWLCVYALMAMKFI